MRLGILFMLLVQYAFAWQFFGLGEKTQEEVVVVRTVLPMDVSFEKTLARSHLNSIREEMGLNTLLHHYQLELAAQAHADYLVSNEESSHYQVSGHSLFIGEKPVDRTLWANYASTKVSENLSTRTYNAQKSIDGLFSAIYHRFAFLALDIDSIGVGVTQEKEKTSNSAFVYVMGNSELERLCHERSFKGSGKYYYKICKDFEHKIKEKDFKKAEELQKRFAPKIVVYPYDGQREVPPVFYEEIPDPLPNHAVSGFPVSVEFNDYYFQEVEVLDMRLYDGANQEVNDVLFMHKQNDPHGRFNARQFTLFPLKRLEYDTHYKVELEYQVKGERKTLSWAFTTRPTISKLQRVEAKNATIQLAKGKSHTLYFPPHHANDILKNIKFPSAVDITFSDHNTLELTVMDESLDEFTLDMEDRLIEIEMTE